MPLWAKGSIPVSDRSNKPGVRQGGYRRIASAALAELETALRELYGDEAPAVLVYGSYARRRANRESDIDVLLLYHKAVRPGREILRVSSILADLNLRYQVLLSVLPASRDEYISSTGPFWDNVRREGVGLEQIGVSPR